jgi:hypothetical protein
VAEEEVPALPRYGDFLKDAFIEKFRPLPFNKISLEFLRISGLF